MMETLEGRSTLQLLCTVSDLMRAVRLRTVMNDRLQTITAAIQCGDKGTAMSVQVCRS